MAGSKIGSLYVVATPIGHLEDVTYRAISTLKSVDVIAAEDTRWTRKLCLRYAVDTPLVPYHEHNESAQTARLVERLERGDHVALVSDAGTPLVSDPGYRLVVACRESAIPVVPIPGPCAAVAALSAAGLPSHRFFFEGFLPVKSGPRRRRLSDLSVRPETIIIYESPRRLRACLQDALDVFGAERTTVIARELTKRFETFRRDSLSALLDWIDAEPQQQKGEIVLLFEGHTGELKGEEDRILDVLRATLPVSQAVELTARITGANKNALYRRAIDH